jgi:hypothetical protein
MVHYNVSGPGGDIPTNINLSKESSVAKNNGSFGPIKSNTTYGDFYINQTPLDNIKEDLLIQPQSSNPASRLGIHTRNIGESDIKIIQTKEIQKIDMDVMDSGGGIGQQVSGRNQGQGLAKKDHQ